MHRFCKLVIVFLALSSICNPLLANLFTTTPDKIVITTDGMYVNFEGNLIPIYSLTQESENSIIVACQSKEYFTPEQIHILPEGIFAIVEGEAIQVPFIAKDETGMYTAKFKTTWTCPKCGAVNNFWSMKCRKCGYSGF